MELMYNSTRNNREKVKASEAILRGLATDGGLYVPDFIPHLDKTIDELVGMNYKETAYEVMKLFFTDFTNCNGNRVINPQSVLNKGLYGCTLNGITFEGNFDDAYISFANFTGSKNAVINPSRLKYETLAGTVCSDITFEGSFDGVDLYKTDFKGSKNAVINPQTINRASMIGCKFTDVVFYGTFENINVSNSSFKGSKNAKFDKTKIKKENRVNTDFTDAYVIGRHLEDKQTLKEKLEEYKKVLSSYIEIKQKRI